MSDWQYLSGDYMKLSAGSTTFPWNPVTVGNWFLVPRFCSMVSRG